MFSSYPDEWPGRGLLLLRGAIGTVLLVRGLSFLLEWHDLNFAETAIALLAVSGLALLWGYSDFGRPPLWLAVALLVAAALLEE